MRMASLSPYLYEPNEWNRLTNREIHHYIYGRDYYCLPSFGGAGSGKSKTQLKRAIYDFAKYATDTKKTVGDLLAKIYGKGSPLVVLPNLGIKLPFNYQRIYNFYKNSVEVVWE